ncbi:CbbX protein [Methyloraptor flagellatus]|uniref:CbbX protein n=1 Tax=Methyloraptor flagellatus TaxID=3162530 RepID=A0AAU7X3Y5_9HYPH
MPTAGPKAPPEYPILDLGEDVFADDDGFPAGASGRAAPEPRPAPRAAIVRDLPQDPPRPVAVPLAEPALSRTTDTAPPVPAPTALDLKALYRDSDVDRILAELDAELVGLEPVKRRIRELVAFLLVARAREQMGLAVQPPTLHMCFSGNPGTGKTTVALRMAGILHRLGFIRRGHLVSVTRDDLVGQYIGHTAPKTREVLKRAMGGVLFIDEAYYLYRPENEKDYGQEAIEILLQVMENQRDDLVVILAGYGSRMDTFFAANPGFRSRVAHHIDFPDYSDDELFDIAHRLAGTEGYRFSPEADEALRAYIVRRKTQPNFANGRSIRNAIDRVRLRQAMRLFESPGLVDREQLQTIEASDIRASRVFTM